MERKDIQENNEMFSIFMGGEKAYVHVYEQGLSGDMPYTPNYDIDLGFLLPVAKKLREKHELEDIDVLEIDTQTLYKECVVAVKFLNYIGEIHKKHLRDSGYYK